MNDQQKYIGKLMASMSQGYPTFKLTEEGIVWYASILDDIEDSEAIAAAAKMLCSLDGQFMPAPGTWRQRAYDIMLAKKNLPSAYEAWEEIIRMGDGSQIKGVVEVEPGKWAITREDRTWKHPIIETVAKRCGWPAFPNPESLSYDRDTFMKAYADHIRREDEQARTPLTVQIVENKYLDAPSVVRRLAERKSV